VKGLVADANIQGQVEYLVQRMQADAWAEFWQALGLVLRRFELSLESGSGSRTRTGGMVFGASRGILPPRLINWLHTGLAIGDNELPLR